MGREDGWCYGTGTVVWAVLALALVAFLLALVFFLRLWRSREASHKDALGKLHEMLMGERLCRDKAEARTRAKSECMTMVSHEIRTPLCAIIGYCDVLMMGGG